MCGLFASIATTPRVDALDLTDETFWQLNWVRVEEPPAGSNIRTLDGKRLWFPVTVRDCTGILSLYISEAAVLKLSGFSAPDLFEAAFVDGKVWFPEVVSIKIISRIKRSSAAQPADQQTQSSTDQPANQVDVHIVDAAWQDLTESPTEASAGLVHFIETVLHRRFAELHSLRCETHVSRIIAEQQRAPSLSAARCVRMNLP